MKFQITFYGPWHEVPGATYSECETLKTITVSAKRMTKKWITDHYGKNHDYKGIYLCSSKNPYGLTWITNYETIHFNDVWDICDGRKVKEPLPRYDHLIINRVYR